jgi:hypothetical protein
LRKMQFCVFAVTSLQGLAEVIDSELVAVKAETCNGLDRHE